MPVFSLAASDWNGDAAVVFVCVRRTLADHIPTIPSCLIPAVSFICAHVLDCVATGDPCQRVWLSPGRPLPTAVSSISPLCCGGSLGPATPVNGAMKGVFAQAPATALLSWGPSWQRDRGSSQGSPCTYELKNQKEAQSPNPGLCPEQLSSALFGELTQTSAPLAF